MKNRYAVTIITGAIALSLLAGCAGYSFPAPADNAGNTEAAVSETEALPEAPAEEVFSSGDGWSVRYDPDFFEVAGIDEHSAQFTYTGEAAGPCAMTISYTEGKQPEELLYEQTSEWTEDPEEVSRIEGIFPGTDDKWGYWRLFQGEEGLYRTAIAGEYNGGVLLFDSSVHNSGDDAIDMAMNDRIADVLDSIAYEDFGPQEMYSYIPGTYAGTGEENTGSVILNEDHSGTVILPGASEEAPILWGSVELIARDNSFRYQYDIEGEMLYLQIGEEWIEFEKEAAEQ